MARWNKGKNTRRVAMSRSVSHDTAIGSSARAKRTIHLQKPMPPRKIRADRRKSAQIGANRIDRWVVV